MPFKKGNTYGRSHKGIKLSDSHRAKLREAAKLKDKRFYTDPERIRKIAESRMGEKHPLWKGDSVSKLALHSWVKRHKPRVKLCEECHEAPPTDLANISQQYRRDINDFRWLCKKCHMEEHKEQYRENIKKAMKARWKNHIKKEDIFRSSTA